MEQVYENAQAIQTFGAGVVALAFIFGLLVFIGIKIVPALDRVGKGIVTSVDALKAVIENFTKTVEMMQVSNAAAISSLVVEIRDMKHGITQSIDGLETKLDYHVICGSRIEDKIDRSIGLITEVRERTRDLSTAQRSTDSRTRKVDSKE